MPGAVVGAVPGGAHRHQAGVAEADGAFLIPVVDIPDPGDGGLSAPDLRNVTRGRGIPRERLAQVGEHYFHFGGVSPINAQNRELIANIEAELSRRGIDLPVYFGNRNWHPFAEDTAKQLLADGRRNVLVFATSAWGGYSACRQYDEDIVKLREAHPEIDEIKFSAPNKHHFLYDLDRFGIENKGEVFIAADRPYGLIEAQVVRDDASDAGEAWTAVPSFI